MANDDLILSGDASAHSLRHTPPHFLSHFPPPITSFGRAEDEEDVKMKRPIYQPHTPYSTSAEMLCSQVQVLLFALFSSVPLVQVSGAPRRNMLTETLGADLTNDKDLAGLLLLKYMSKLMAVRGDEVLPKPWEEEEVGVREEVMRRHLPLSQRERKAGCRNFFWKTFTSC